MKNDLQNMVWQLIDANLQNLNPEDQQQFFRRLRYLADERIGAFPDELFLDETDDVERIDPADILYH